MQHGEEKSALRKWPNLALLTAFNHVWRATVLWQ